MYKRQALGGGRGVDSGNVAGAALESWNGVLCGRLQRDDGAGCEMCIRDRSERAILYFFGGGMVIGPDKGDLPVMRKL